jgi:catechol 2,3-dioxygenase-like lactoylglutathione lyase family enzyme
MRGVIDHIAREVTDLERSARFYDAVFYALGARRIRTEPGEVAWGRDGPVFRIQRGEAPPGHVALRAAGKAAVEAAWEAGCSAGGVDDGPPVALCEEGIRCYAAALRDPDGLRVEFFSR